MSDPRWYTIATAKLDRTTCAVEAAVVLGWLDPAYMSNDDIWTEIDQLEAAISKLD